MLQKQLEISDLLGSLTIYHNKTKQIFLVEPTGVIASSLVKADLAHAFEFGKNYGAMALCWEYGACCSPQSTSFVLH